VQSGDGTVVFCISATVCSAAQSVPASNGIFVTYSASFPITPGTLVTAGMTLAVNDFAPQYFAGIGEFRISSS
jgi:hypothetical protein